MSWRWGVRLALLSVLWGASQGAWAQAPVPCRSSVWVETTGYWTDSDAQVAVDSAVVAAVSTAIASARGIQVVSETTLVESYRSSIRGGGTTGDAAYSSESELVNRISTRLSGHVIGFTIVNTFGPDAYGLIGATVRTNVCLDARMLLSLGSNTAGAVDPELMVASLAAHVAPQAERLGWWLIPQHYPNVDLTRSSAMDLIFSSGATAVLQGALRGQVIERSASLVSYEALISYSLIDVTTGAVLAANATMAARGVGYTDGAALQAAMDQLSADLGRAITLALVPVEALPLVVFTFDPIRRQGSAFTIGDRLATLPGVIEVGQSQLDGTALSIRVRLNNDPCAVARALVDWTRLRLSVAQCGPFGAEISVQRE
jgi:hypothetical protein